MASQGFYSVKTIQ